MVSMAMERMEAILLRKKDRGDNKGMPHMAKSDDGILFHHYGTVSALLPHKTKVMIPWKRIRPSYYLPCLAIS